MVEGITHDGFGLSSDRGAMAMAKTATVLAVFFSCEARKSSTKEENLIAKAITKTAQVIRFEDIY